VIQNPEPPEPPAELADPGRALWASLVGEYSFDEHERPLLLQVCRTWDRLDRIARAAADCPLTVVNAKGDMVSNPVLVEERMQSQRFAQLKAALRLPEENPGPGSGNHFGPRGPQQRRKYGSVTSA
jgi:hypothetical protein